MDYYDFLSIGNYWPPLETDVSRGATLPQALKDSSLVCGIQVLLNDQ